MGIFTEDYSNETAVFGGGCFWCTEAVFKMLKGVVSVMPGYAGGGLENPGYDDVMTGKSGHAEVVEVVFNPDIISYEDLLTVFFATHDPATLNRQGQDVGEQYRSVIFYTTKAQEKKAKRFMEKIETSSAKVGHITTQLRQLKIFYEAEEHHRDYYKKNPDKAYCQVVINPKLEKVKKDFAKLLKNEPQHF